MPPRPMSQPPPTGLHECSNQQPDCMMPAPHFEEPRHLLPKQENGQDDSSSNYSGHNNNTGSESHDGNNLHDWPRLSMADIADKVIKKPHNSHQPGSNNGRWKTPLVCQVANCFNDLSDLKPYYQRHRICLVHFKIPALEIEGEAARFCNQCGGFQSLTAFDGKQRTCRQRLERHNTRRKLSKFKQSLGGQMNVPRHMNLMSDDYLPLWKEASMHLPLPASAAASVAAPAPAASGGPMPRLHSVHSMPVSHKRAYDDMAELGHHHHDAERGQPHPHGRAPLTYSTSLPSPITMHSIDPHHAHSSQPQLKQQPHPQLQMHPQKHAQSQPQTHMQPTPELYPPGGDSAAEQKACGEWYPEGHKAARAAAACHVPPAAPNEGDQYRQYQYATHWQSAAEQNMSIATHGQALQDHGGPVATSSQLELSNSGEFELVGSRISDDGDWLGHGGGGGSFSSEENNRHHADLSHILDMWEHEPSREDASRHASQRPHLQHGAEMDAFNASGSGDGSNAFPLDFSSNHEEREHEEATTSKAFAYVLPPIPYISSHQHVHTPCVDDSPQAKPTDRQLEEEIWKLLEGGGAAGLDWGAHGGLDHAHYYTNCPLA